MLYKPKTSGSTLEIVSQLSFELTPMSDIKVIGFMQHTSVPGVFAVGDWLFKYTDPVATYRKFLFSVGCEFWNDSCNGTDEDGDNIFHALEQIFDEFGDLFAETSNGGPIHV